MKTVKFIFCALAAVLAAVPLSARGGPAIIAHLGVSGTPLVAGNYFTDGNSSTYQYGTMSSLYGDYTGPISTTGTFLAGVDVKLNRVVAISVDLGINAMFTDNYSGISNQKTGSNTGIAAYLFPKVKLYYMDKAIIRLYGTVGLGVGKYFGYPTNTTSSGMFANPLKPEVQLVPFGLEVGHKFFGFAELGVGTIFMGVHVGAGYKF